MSGGAGDYLEGYVKVDRALEKASHAGKVLGHLVDGGDRTNTSGSSIKSEYSQVLESLQVGFSLTTKKRTNIRGLA